MDPAALAGEELTRRLVTIDGHDAVRIESRAQGDAQLPESTRTTRWLIVFGRDRTLSLVTHEVSEDGDYESHRDVLYEMANRLQLPLDR